MAEPADRAIPTMPENPEDTALRIAPIPALATDCIAFHPPDTAEVIAPCADWTTPASEENAPDTAPPSSPATAIAAWPSAPKAGISPGLLPVIQCHSDFTIPISHSIAAPTALIGLSTLDMADTQVISLIATSAIGTMTFTQISSRNPITLISPTMTGTITLIAAPSPDTPPSAGAAARHVAEQLAERFEQLGQFLDHGGQGVADRADDVPEPHQNRLECPFPEPFQDGHQEVEQPAARARTRPRGNRCWRSSARANRGDDRRDGQRRPRRARRRSSPAAAPTADSAGIACDSAACPSCRTRPRPASAGPRRFVEHPAEDRDLAEHRGRDQRGRPRPPPAIIAGPNRWMTSTTLSICSGRRFSIHFAQLVMIPASGATSLVTATPIASKIGASAPPGASAADSALARS